MKISRELRKPANWQDFERLCCIIWKSVWNDPNAKLNGRSGQSQNGVDIYGHDNKKPGYSGVQCKRYDKISEAIIDDEIAKAQSFNPPLEHLTIATTVNRDVKIEEYIRQKDVENRKNGLFGVSIMEWEDLVEILEQHPPLMNWYENSIGMGITSSIALRFSDGSEELNLQPKFIKIIYYNEDAHSINKRNSIVRTPSISHPFAYDLKVIKKQINHSYAPINIVIDNIGLSSIRPINVILKFPDEVTINSTNEYSDYDFLRISHFPTNTQIRKEDKMVKFYLNSGILPNRRAEIATIYVKPNPGIQYFDIEWDLSTDNFTSKGKLKVKVSADIRQEYRNCKTHSLPDPQIIDDMENLY